MPRTSQGEATGGCQSWSRRTRAPCPFPSRRPRPMARRRAIAALRFASSRPSHRWTRPAASSTAPTCRRRAATPAPPPPRRRRRPGAGRRLGLPVGRRAAADPVLGRPGAAAVLPLWVLLNKLLGLYDRDASLIHKSTLDELPQIVHSLSLGAALLPARAAVVPVRAHCATRRRLVGRGARPHARSCARRPRRRAHRLRARAVPDHRLGHVAAVVARKIGPHPEYGVSLVGYVDVPHEDGDRRGVGELERLGDVSDFEEVCREHDVERVVIAFSSLDARGPARRHPHEQAAARSRSPSCRGCSR